MRQKLRYGWLRARTWSIVCVLVLLPLLMASDCDVEIDGLDGDAAGVLGIVLAVVELVLSIIEVAG